MAIMASMLCIIDVRIPKTIWRLVKIATKLPKIAHMGIPSHASHHDGVGEYVLNLAAIRLVVPLGSLPART